MDKRSPAKIAAKEIAQHLNTVDGIAWDEARNDAFVYIINEALADKQKSKVEKFVQEHSIWLGKPPEKYTDDLSLSALRECIEYQKKEYEGRHGWVGTRQLGKFLFMLYCVRTNQPEQDTETER